MIPRILVDTADIPGGKGELRLFRRDLKNGPEFSIMLGGNELMNSRLSGSEELLASLTCKHLSPQIKPEILIGGLGMGFTLRKALSLLSDDAKLTVSELVPAVIQWARGPMTDIFGDCLFDPRTKIIEEDVRHLIEGTSSDYDAIILDVDNGPDGLTHDDNGWLYSKAGLQAARAALRPEGILAVWSSADDASFTNRLRRSGFDPECIPVRAHNNRGAHHMIWLARR